MKGVLLATVVSVLILVGMTAIFRLYRVTAFAALAVFVVALFCFLLLFAALPNDAGFLPPALVADSQWLDFIVGFFVLSASFFGGWLQLFNVTDRGYSLRMLVDMLHRPDRAMTVEEIVNEYADGHGLRWMYDIRIDGILRTGLVTDSNETLSLTPRGFRVAKHFGLLRRLYKIGKHPA
jgi:hypothetical protein